MSEKYKFWKFFEEISAIPHGSGNTDAASKYIVDFAKERGLKYRKDESGNVVVFKDASKNGNSDITVMLQSHLDMVTVSKDGKKDFLKEGIELVLDGEYLRANGTTLGADDGIGVAYTLAVLDDNDFDHPNIEGVFTTDEEIGMLGAAAMDMSDLRSNYMLNIDSEDDGIFTAGCAGSTLCVIEKDIKSEPADGYFYKITFSNLTGGHSGIEIIKNRGNAYRLLGRLMLMMNLKGVGVRFVSIDGGGKDNAIAKSCEAVISSETAPREFERIFKEESDKIIDAFKLSDPNMKIECVDEGFKENEQVITGDDSNTITALLTEVPDGVVRMFAQEEPMTETSLNLGIVKADLNHIKMTICLRSNVEAQRDFLKEVVRNIVNRLGAEISFGAETEIWTYRPESSLRDLITRVYEEKSGKKAQIEVIHASVECGIFSKNIPGLDCVSFGPDIYDIHTYNEKIDIKSAEMYWEIIKEVLMKF